MSAAHAAVGGAMAGGTPGYGVGSPRATRRGKTGRRGTTPGRGVGFDNHDHTHTS